MDRFGRKNLLVLLCFCISAMFTAQATQSEKAFFNVSQAAQSVWTEADIGTVVRTYSFNTQVSQLWVVQQHDPTNTSEFGVAAGDLWLKLLHSPRGVTLSELGGVPSHIDPLFDNVPIWQEAQRLNVPIVLDAFYAGLGSFETLRDGLKVIGTGKNTSGLIGLDSTAEVLSTASSGFSGTRTNLSFADFSIKGVGSAAMVIAHTSGSSFDGIGIEQFDGVHGFVFEYMWSNQIGHLQTNGASLSGSPFMFNAGVLDSVFAHLYTSNMTQHSFDFNHSRVMYSNPQASGSGVNTIMMLTAQGASDAAIRIDGLSRYKILNVYTENNQQILHVSGGVSDVSISGDFQGVRSNTQRSILLDGNISGFTLVDVSLPDKLIEIGQISADVYFSSPRVTGNKDIVGLLRRNANTPSSMPLTIDYQTSSHSKKLVKTNGWSWKFRSMYVDNNGNWQSDLIDIPMI